MGLDSHSGVLRVREVLEERGFEPEVVELERTARSAAEAADALGLRAAQIVKSLVLRGRETGRPVLVLAGGANRVDVNKISRLLSEPVEMADAAYVREKTGFAIGGVPPLGHAERPETFLDEDLLLERGLDSRRAHTRSLRAGASRAGPTHRRAGGGRQVRMLPRTPLPRTRVDREHAWSQRVATGATIHQERRG
jgi:prolyl-tRNA editing enzyme YbaK/EbsC (Cys-tRNA(Pro) deacylase)